MKKQQAAADSGAAGPAGGSPDRFTASSGYEIRVAGYLDPHWADWLGGLALCHDREGNTLLRGVVADQAALHGILVQIRDLGVTILSLQRIASQ